ncbi:MAG: NTP transferase domain-containing protein [bacterium]|nr:NTP transferase domain-containing protein [bacterium]MCP5069169.1 NTP transferase domain-containing protein [bacterium]
MRAVLLAAGWGTRLGPIREANAKALIPIGSRRAIDWAADAAEAVQAVQAIDVLANEKSRAAVTSWAASRAGRLSVRVLGNGVASPERKRGAVADLAGYIANTGIDEDLLILAADNVFDFSLADLAERVRQTPSVAVYDVGSPRNVKRYASVKLATDGAVTALVEKDPAPASSLAVTALYGIPRARLADVETYLAGGHPADNLGYLAEWWCASGCLQAVQVEGTWIDVGSPDDLARARRLLG